jgi:RNA polymerase sigma factor (sigma-70 family)
MNEMDTSPSLLMRIRDPQDGVSWSAFVDVYTPIVFRYLTTRGLQAADAADVAQDTLIEVLSSIRRLEYDPRIGRFRDWLATITKRKLYRFWNRNKPTVELSELLANDGIDAEWVDVFQFELLQKAIQRVRQQVEESTWRVFEETWIKNIAAAEVAEALGIPIGLVYSSKARFLKRLEFELQSLGDDFDSTLHRPD